MQFNLSKQRKYLAKIEKEPSSQKQKKNNNGLGECNNLDVSSVGNLSPKVKSQINVIWR
jgi:hypothetical protein